MATALRASTISTYLGNKSRSTEVERSVKGRTKGSFSRGYEVRTWVDGTVRVGYTLGSSAGGSPAYQAKTKRTALDALLKVLLWDYEVEDHKSYLVVVKKKTGCVPELRSQSVSAVLGRAAKETGIVRSEYSTTRIRGWGHWTTGYEVKQTSAGIQVDYVMGSNRHPQPDDLSNRKLKLMQLAEVLGAKYTVTWSKRGMNHDVLIITVKK